MSQTLMRLLAQIAPSDLPVMISGEPGTGKAAVARYVHQSSGRTGAFVRVSCRAVADQIARADLDTTRAHDRADSSLNCEGWFEAARGGTLFLDELADMPAGVQDQLLCLLQEQDTSRAAPNDNCDRGVRLIAATPIDLAEVAAAGHFRLDLLHRLNVGRVHVLPLRQRRADIAPIAEHFIQTYAKRLNVLPPLLDQDALAALIEYPWPGNVRELEAIIRRALLIAPGRDLRIEHLKLTGVGIPSHLRGADRPAATQTPVPLHSLNDLLAQMFATPAPRLLDHVESQLVSEAFQFTGRNQVKTAALLGISRNVLRTLLSKHGLFTVRRRRG
jgi:DNA-binding NtrC family response regulator